MMYTRSGDILYLVAVPSKLLIKSEGKSFIWYSHVDDLLGDILRVLPNPCATYITERMDKIMATLK